MPYLPQVNGYTAPPSDARNDTKLGWLREQAESAETFLKSQRVWPDIDRCKEILSGSSDTKIPAKQSKVWINMTKRDVREIVATLANLRPLWGFKTDNPEYQKQNTVLNKMLMAWYMMPKTYGAIRRGIQFWAGTGMGYLSPMWQSDGLIAGRGDIVLKAYDATNVLPFGLNAENDLQMAYAVTIRVETPIQTAMALYPTKLDFIVPDRGAPTWLKRGTRRMQRFLSPVLNMFGPGSDRDKEDSPFPTVDIYNTYVLDTSINETGADIWMGTNGTNWRYKVPTYGSDIETGQRENGQPVYRKAAYEDAKLYPLRRLMVWTSRGCLHDDTSPWWHGKVPLVKMVLDDSPWDYLGFPPPREAIPIQDAATSLLRGVVDAANVRLNPPIGYDENVMSRALMERFNPRVAGQRIAINMQQSDGMKTVIPVDHYDVGTWIPGLVDQLYEKIHYLFGTRDVNALAKARQVPSGDSIEKLMELSGPILTDMSRCMEGSMVELGEMWKGLAFQFYSMKRRVQILGKDGVTEEDYDFDPGNMIPSHLQDEEAAIRQNIILSERSGQPYTIPQSRASVVERARSHINSFYFHVTPNSMHQITQLTKKMLMLQLWKGQFPIDPWSVADAMDIDNFGSPHNLKEILGTSEVPSDKFGRWLMWRELLQKMTPQQGQPGRKGSGQTPPAHQSKDGGTRSTVRESPR